MIVPSTLAPAATTLAALAVLAAGSPALAQATKPYPAPQLDDVVVTGTRTERHLADTPIATEVISRAEIEASAALNAADLLLSRAGVEVVTSFAGDTIRLQGLDSQHVLILVDGRRVTGRLSGAVDLSRFPVESLERIEIVRGGSSALYGSEAMGGVVNLITRQAKSPLSFETQGAYGSLNTGLFSGSAAFCNEAVASRVTAGWRRQDAYDLTPQTVGTTSAAFDELTVSNGNTFQLGAGRALKTHVDYLNRGQQGIEGSATGAVFDRRNQTESLSAAIEPELTLPGLSNLKLAAYYNHFRDQYLKDQRGSNALDAYQETLDQLFQVNAQDERPLGEQHILTTGAEVAYERLQTDRLNASYGERIRAAVYTQNEWQALGNLVVLPGVRMDVDSRYGSNLAPKLALRYDPFQALTLRATLGTGFRAPDFKELMLQFQNAGAGYEVIGNPDLRPETSRSLNLGVESRLTSWAGLAVNLYRNEIENLNQSELYRPASEGNLTQYRYVNVSSAVTQGVEALLRFEPFDGLTLEPGYTLNDTLDRAHNRPLEGRPLHKGTLTARYQHDAWGFGAYVRGAIHGTRPFFDDAVTPATTVQAPGYTTLEARLTQRLTPQVSAFVQGSNLLDAGDPTYLPIQPLTILAGLQTRF